MHTTSSDRDQGIMMPSLTGGDAQGEAASPSGLSLRWQRAAMLGSLWAANEIVLGSFLHNVGVPFTGTLLACIGVLLLVAGHRLWNDPGVIWRAGVICSMMKSISPSSVILGPMVGILAESGLVFLCIVLFRGLFIGSLLGGMLAAMTPILQKIISILVAYGMDAARMYASLFTLLSDRMQLHGVDAKEALLVLIALQAIPGALAALAGIAIARGVNRVGPVSAREEAPAPQGGRREASNTPHRYSLTALGMHTLLLPAGLALLPSLPPLLTPAPVAAYLSAVLLRYPGLRVRFKRLRLWLEFGAVAILAGVLLGVLAPGGKGTWWSGLQSGIAMAARATLVVAAFSAISVELRNPTVLNWFLQRGLGNVSAALSAAFRVLPVMIQALQQQRTGFRHPLRSLSRMLATMLAQIQENPEERAQPAVCILTGNQGEGKTTLLHRVAGRLRSEGIAVGGILAPVRSAGTERTGYDVEDLMTGERTTLCRTGQASGGHSVGPFVVLQEGLSLGARALAVAREIPGALVVVDEVGPLELRGEGWATPAKDLLSSGVAAVVFVVRRTLVHQVQEQWRFRARHVWDVRQTNEEQILGALRPMVRAGSASPDDGVRAG